MMATRSNMIKWMRFPLAVVLESLMKALKSLFHFQSWLVRKGALVCEFSGFYLVCQREFHVSVKDLVIDRSVKITLFGDLFRHMKPCPAQHAVLVFPAKRPLETKLCMLIFQKRITFQTQISHAGFFIHALQIYSLSEESNRGTSASSTTLTETLNEHSIQTNCSVWS